MPSVCPRPCSRLATAAVFLSVGVVQFIVGVILLKSRFVYLLAGPDFWTSSCNVAVGCLLGVSAFIWGTSRKRESKKHAIRRRLLLALVSSALLMNATTLGILVLGEGNALLSIRLESQGESDETILARELLAYAYVTSVCCPVVCIVVSIVSISGNCFSVSRKNSIERKFSLGSFKKRKSESLQWVYAKENRDLAKSKPQDLVSSSSSEESENDSGDVAVMRQRHSSSIEELQSVLSRMAQGNRDSILRDSALMLRQLDLRRQNRLNSLNQDGSYIGPSLIRMKEFSASERSPRTASNESNYPGNTKICNPKRYSSELGESSRLEPGGPRLVYSGSDKLDMKDRNPYSRKYADCRDSSQTREVIYSSHNMNHGGKLMKRPRMIERESCLPSYVHDYNVNGDIIFSHKAFKPTPEIEYSQRSVAEEHHICERNEESLDDEILTNEIKRRHYETGRTKENPHSEATKNKGRSRYKATKTKEALFNESYKSKEGSHHGTSEMEKESCHETSKAIERSYYETEKAKEGLHYETGETNGGSLYEGSRIRDGSSNETSQIHEEPRYGTSKPKERSPNVNSCFSPEGSDFSEESILDSSRTSPWAGEMISISFKNPSVARLSDKLIPVASPMIPTHQEHDLPKMSEDSGIFSIQSTSFSSDIANHNESNGKDRKVSSFRENVKDGKEQSQEFPKAGSKKYDLSRVVTMASISEEPNHGADEQELKSASSSQCSGQETPRLSLESRRVSLPSVFSDSKEIRRQHEDSQRNYSPRRKKSLSTKDLKKQLSAAISSNPDFLDQAWDKDSLIGLSEEELIARQIRSRSLRKAIQRRIKDEMMV